MINAEVFKQVFGIYATELWAMSESDFLEWLNAKHIATELRPKDGWIPCSERLPDEDGCYLTTTMYKEVYCDHWSGVNFDRTEMVIAWMELPQPYRGDIE